MIDEMMLALDSPGSMSKVFMFALLFKAECTWIAMNERRVRRNFTWIIDRHSGAK
jgi:hypothetical protein